MKPSKTRFLRKKYNSLRMRMLILGVVLFLIGVFFKFYVNTPEIFGLKNMLFEYSGILILIGFLGMVIGFFVRI